MVRLKNLTDAEIGFPVGKNEDGSVKVACIAPGAVEPIDLAEDHPLVAGFVAASAVSIEAGRGNRSAKSEPSA